MPKFGHRSTNNLKSVHNDLQLIMNEAVKHFDFTVLEGHRTVERQNELFHQGKSKIDGFKKLGKHNHLPSLAVDIAPYPIDWNDKKRFYYLGGLIKGIAAELLSKGLISHRVRWGGDWDNDGDFNDNSFIDLPHFELIK